jgi:hypothetical protein
MKEKSTRELGQHLLSWAAATKIKRVLLRLLAALRVEGDLT